MEEIISRRTSFAFSPRDWLRDIELRRCSPLARAVWIDLMCLMHEGSPYGHLADKTGTALDVKFVASQIGLSGAQLKKAIAELEERGVSSRSGSGVLFSRRMVRDEKTRLARAAGGYGSVNHPNVPRKKPPLEGTLPDDAEDTLEGPNVRTFVTNERTKKRTTNERTYSAEDILLVRKSLISYMNGSGKGEPDDDLVLRILDASGGATGLEINNFLVERYESQPPYPRSRYGPKGWGWFEPVVKTHFSKRQGTK